MSNPAPKIAVVAIVKNEGPYLEEWVNHYLSIGVDHIFLYDNGSTDNTAAVLRKYLNHGFVTHLNFPKFYGQIEAYNHAISLFGHHFDWIGFFDADEFLVIKSHQDVKSYLADVPVDFDQIKIPWMVFGFSGHKEKPAGLLSDNYRHAAPPDPNGRTVINCKSFVRPANVGKFYCHAGQVGEGKTCDADFAPSDNGGSLQNPSYKSAQVNHYYTKSEAEFLARVSRGTADGTVKHRFGIERDRNYSFVDDAYQVHCSDGLRRTYDRIAALPEEPMRFGVGFSFKYHVHDGTIWDFERVLSNHLHGVNDLKNTFAAYRKFMWGFGGVIFLPETHEFDIAEFVNSSHFADFESKKRIEVQFIGESEGDGVAFVNINTKKSRRVFTFGEITYPETDEKTPHEITVTMNNSVRRIPIRGITAGKHVFVFEASHGYVSGYNNALTVKADNATLGKFATLLQP